MKFTLQATLSLACALRGRGANSSPSFTSAVANKSIGLQSSTTLLVDSANTASDTSSTALRGSSGSKTAKEAYCDGLRTQAELVISEDWGFEVSDEELNDFCLGFVPSDIVPNDTCPFGYDPQSGFSNGDLGFYQVTGYLFPRVALALENVCECIYGYDLGCASIIPRTGDEFAYQGNSETSAKWANFCLAAGVWNGDYLEGVLPNDNVKECGCYFISQAMDKVGSCPGVNLGMKVPTASPQFSASPISVTPTLFPTPENSDPPTFSPPSASPISVTPTLFPTPESSDPPTFPPASASPISETPTLFPTPESSSDPPANFPTILPTPDNSNINSASTESSASSSPSVSASPSVLTALTV
jgi:hypothetical protein